MIMFEKIAIKKFILLMKKNKKDNLTPERLELPTV